MRATAALALCLVALTGAVTFSSIKDQHCAFSGAPGCKSQWRRTVKAADNYLHNVVISIKHKEGAARACDSLIYDQVNPNSTYYGKYLSLEEANRKFRSYENLNKAQTWLESVGLETVARGFWLHVTAPVSQLNEIFQADFHHFMSTSGKSKHIVRTKSYTIPSHVESYIDFISNTVVFPQVKSQILAPLVDTDGTVTPQFINQFYNIKSNKGSAKATQSVFEDTQDFSSTDLSTFQSTYNLPNQAVAKVVGPNDESQCDADPNNCGEANLDLQYMMAVAQNSPTWFWAIDPNIQDPFYAWAQDVGNMQNPPLVHSISYGSVATENPVNDMDSFNTELCILGTRGITVTVSSGDDGVANYEARDDSSKCGFNPSFPATSPYVVAVGATQGPEAGNPEIACTSSTGGLITTGGGFSVTFAQPSYQAAVVNNYLKNGPNMPPTSQFNSKGRGYPDVALLGYNYVVYIGGSAQQVSGTSASSPVFAGMLSLINARRLQAGKSSLGFVNPALYKLAASTKGIFNDITSGVNNCCAAEYFPTCCTYGFTATTGWDPLTGLGSVNFEKLAAALLKI